MNDPIATDAAPERIAPAYLVLRLVWVAVQLVLVYWFAQRGDLFYYQGF